MVCAAVVVLAAFEVVDILDASLIAIAVLLLTRTLTPSDVRNAVDIDVIVLIGAAFGLGFAMENTGVAATVAEGLVVVFDGFGDFGLVLGLIVATAAVTELITNNAAAVLLFPVALNIAATTGLNQRGLALAVAVAASASFLTPIGYQTNMMVYGPGGYRFTDYTTLGIPMNLASCRPRCSASSRSGRTPCRQAETRRLGLGVPNRTRNQRRTESHESPREDQRLCDDPPRNRSRPS